MKRLAWRAALSLLLFGWVSLCTCNATVIAQSSLSFSNLQITPSTGTATFLGPWSAEAFADANGVGNFDATFDGVTPALTSSSAPFATSSAIASPLLLTGNASSAVNIPDGVVTTSFATGRASLYNSFVLSGGTGEVNVTFSTALAGTLNVLTNSLGLEATTETVFALDLDGDSVLFRRDMLSIGPNSAANSVVATTLTGSRSLQFGVPYFIFVQADSESRGRSTVPEIGTFLTDSITIVLVVVALLLVRRKAFPRRSAGA